jgi:hypothetical protein
MVVGEDSPNSQSRLPGALATRRPRQKLRQAWHGGFLGRHGRLSGWQQPKIGVVERVGRPPFGRAERDRRSAPYATDHGHALMSGYADRQHSSPERVRSGPSQVPSIFVGQHDRDRADGDGQVGRIGRVVVETLIVWSWAMFSRTLAFGVAMSTLAAATTATAQHSASPQASPAQASPQQATPLAERPPTSSTETARGAEAIIRLQEQRQSAVNGAMATTATVIPNPGGVTQSGSAGSVSRAPLLAPLRPVRPR